ncbi:MAG: histone deacetylase [Candidatus Bathyarchaeota archaeon]|nr:histone deacetylase [Candidatus Bathyarchaeota archaeon]
MHKTAVVFSPIYYRHDPGKSHPESARRLHAIVRELKKGEVTAQKNWKIVKPENASIDDVELVHGIEYIRLVEAVCRSGGGLLDLEDTIVSPESYRVALHAVGGALKAVKLVLKGYFQNAFALVRPPGHHASKYRACGFCLFNNVAIVAKYLIEKCKVERVLILDVDAHHGNGTQEIFFDTNKVLYVSLHEDPYGFPGTGFAGEVGEGEGEGYNVNVPLPFMTADDMYLRAMKEIVEPIVLQYDPQFVLVSAGFDGHLSDPVGNLSLSESCYQKVFGSIVDLASKTACDRLVSVLEGGYNVRFLGKNAAIALAVMSSTSCKIHSKFRKSSRGVRKRGEKVIEEVRKLHKKYWDL